MHKVCVRKSQCSRRGGRGMRAGRRGEADGAPAGAPRRTAARTGQPQPFQSDHSRSNHQALEPFSPQRLLAIRHYNGRGQKRKRSRHKEEGRPRERNGLLGQRLLGVVRVPHLLQQLSQTCHYHAGQSTESRSKPAGGTGKAHRCRSSRTGTRRSGHRRSRAGDPKP